MKINFKSLSTNLGYQEYSISEMYAQGLINGSELEELQKALNGLYQFNRKMRQTLDSDCYVSPDHIETKW